MVRRFVEVVHVGLEDVPGGVAGQARPAAFQWRGQRYVVHEVLGHWRERRAWWAGGAERVLASRGLEVEMGWSSGPAGHASAALSVAEVVPSQRSWVDELGEEYEVWRVEARRGRSAAIGVYDLCHDGHTRPALSTWRLLRMVD